jgi:hypothetical protein
MTRVLAAASLATVVAFGFPAEAESRFAIRVVVGDAYGHGRYARPRYDQYAENAYRIGYGRGYEEGFDEGKDDAEDRDRFNFWDDKDYRHADRGYRDHYGPRDTYARGFRSGFEEGYRRAYGHFDRRHDHGRCDVRYWAREIPRDRYPR